MGRKWNKKGKGGPKPANKVEKPRRERTEGGSYVVAVKENKDFEVFYKKQNLVSEEEWPSFMSSLQSSLPAAFRITGNSTQAEALREILIQDFFKPLELLSPEDLLTSTKPPAKADVQTTAADNSIQGGADDAEEPVKPLQPVCLSWYPKGLAYQLNLSRRDIRRCEAYWRLHQCLIAETDTGSISRQEAVSMIPPLLLDVQPHHKVLDMCAAPGSKTAQIIEQLHSSSDPVMSAIPTGVVVANDADNKRCYLLTHQAKRLQSPSIIITNHDAAFMPNMFYTKPDGSSGKLKYDRVLCDVPCSGDGTLRKNCDVWTKWNPVNGANLHGLQLRIARRGLELLAVGGRMVYSTCSMSPMENEAVLQRLLLEADGAVSLVDCSDVLPGLKRRNGLTKWCVMTKDMEEIPSPEEIPLKLSNVYHKHLFPAAKDLKLERCLRLLPHHQDTGGFFVAVLQKDALLPGERQDTTSSETQPLHSQRVKPHPKKRRRNGFKEEPYYYMSDSIADWEKARLNGSESSFVDATVNATPKVALKISHTEAGLAGAESRITSTENDASGTGNQASGAENATSSAEKGTSATENQASNAENGTSGTENSTSSTKNQVPGAEDSSTGVEAMELDTTAAVANSAPSTPGDSSAAQAKLDPQVEDLKIWSTISPFFGFRRDLPEASYTNFMTRSREGKRRNLYFTNALCRDLVVRNQDRMKIINTGVKVLVRVDNKGAECDFRLAQEGVQSIIPLLTKRRVRVTKPDLLVLLNDDDSDTPPDISSMSEVCKTSVRGMPTGSVLLEYAGDPTLPEEEQQNAAPERLLKMELVGWKGKSTLRCYVARNDRVHYLRLLRADTSRYLKNKFVQSKPGTPAQPGEDATNDGGSDLDENNIETALPDELSSSSTADDDVVPSEANVSKKPRISTEESEEMVTS